MKIIWSVWPIQSPRQRRQTLVEAAYRPQLLGSWIKDRISISLNSQMTQLGMAVLAVLAVLIERIEYRPCRPTERPATASAIARWSTYDGRRYHPSGSGAALTSRGNCACVFAILRPPRCVCMTFELTLVLTFALMLSMTFTGRVAYATVHPARTGPP